jgi:hypothetical protein
MTKPKSPPADAHVVVEVGGVCVCKHCGTRQKIIFPCSVAMFGAIVDQFVREHVNCELKEERKV